MHADHILFVFVNTVHGVCVHNTHACPNDNTTDPQASGGDTQTELVTSGEDISTQPTSSSGEGIPTEPASSGDDVPTEIVSSGDVMPTEPVSSGEPPTNGSKTCTCPDGVTKGIDCKLKIRRMKARIIPLRELHTKKVMLKFNAKHCNPNGKEKEESFSVEIKKLDIVWPRDQFLLFSKQCWISHSYELLDDAGKPLQWDVKLHGNRKDVQVNYRVECQRL